MIFSIKDIVNAKEGAFKWINIYGAPKGYSGEHAVRMNNHPE